MDYAACVWGDSFIGHSNTTFRLEKRAARKIMDAPWDAPSTALLSDINIHYVSCVPCGTCGLCVPCVPFSVETVFPLAPVSLASPAGVFRGARFSSLEGEKRAPLKTSEWEATVSRGVDSHMKQTGCSSKILNLTPKGDHLDVAQAFCDP